MGRKGGSSWVACSVVSFISVVAIVTVDAIPKGRKTVEKLTEKQVRATGRWAA